MENHPKTLFCDIDGCLLFHQGSPSKTIKNKAQLLSEAVVAFDCFHAKGHRLILTTGRSESMRELTEGQLREAGLSWDFLLMGIGSGERILINDITNITKPKAVAINLPRNDGFGDIDKLYHEAKIKAGAVEEHYPSGLVKEFRI